MVMTRPALLCAIDNGRIFVHPFEPKNVNSASIDVRLGRHFYVESYRQGFGHHSQPLCLNPWSEESVEAAWDEGDLQTLDMLPNSERTFMEKHGFTEAIRLNPGETALAHTMEFIGGTDNLIVPSMQARSSLGRCNVSVCSCAGWGDVRYHNRWTLELKNRSQRHAVLLPVGMRIAQIVFEEGTEPTDKQYQQLGGKYQDTHATLHELVEAWKPSDMLPKAWKDRELER